MNIKNRFNSHW